MIQTAVNAYYTKNNATFPVNQTIQLLIENSTDFTLEQFGHEGIISDTITLYEIDYELIGIDSLKYGRKQDGTNDVYVLSKENGKVYYAKGLKIGSDIYYTLTEDISDMLNYNSDKNIVNSPIILFQTSKTDWTKDDVSILVKIPTENMHIYYVRVVYEDGTSAELSMKEEKNGYYTYLATQSGNYSVEVKYQLRVSGSEIKTAKYSIKNVDKVSPSIEIDTSNKVKIETDDAVGYMKVISKSDDLSGIKKVKYDYGDYVTTYTENDIISHFEDFGVDLEDDIIFIKSGYDKITVYIEDNAGNFYSEVLDAKI